MYGKYSTSLLTNCLASQKLNKINKLPADILQKKRKIISDLDLSSLIIIKSAEILQEIYLVGGLWSVRFLLTLPPALSLFFTLGTPLHPSE